MRFMTRKKKPEQPKPVDYSRCKDRPVRVEYCQPSPVGNPNITERTKKCPLIDAEVDLLSCTICKNSDCKKPKSEF